MQGHWSVTDLSRNGTVVDGTKLGKGNGKQLKGGEEIIVSHSTPGDDSTWVKWKFVVAEGLQPQSANPQSPAIGKRKSVEPRNSAEETPGRQTSVEPATAGAKRPRTADGTGQSALYAQNANLRKQLEEALEAHQQEADDFRRRSKEQEEKHAQQLLELRTKLSAAETKRAAESLEEECRRLKQELQEVQAAAGSKSASLTAELQLAKEAAAAAEAETAVLTKSTEAAKAAADLQVKAAQEESARLRAEASEAADKARNDLAALEEELHKANSRWKKAQGREQVVRNDLQDKEALIQDMQLAYAKSKESLRIQEQLLDEERIRVDAARVRIDAARRDYEEDAAEFEQHLEFALGAPAPLDVAEPGDETGWLAQVETQDLHAQPQQLANATQVLGQSMQDPAPPPQTRPFGSPPAARPCDGSPARTAKAETRTVKGSILQPGAELTSQHAGSGHMGTPSPGHKAASLEVDTVAAEQNLEEQLAAAESQKQEDEVEAREKKQTELKANGEGEVVVVGSQDSKLEQPKENRPPSESGENVKTGGGKQGSQQHGKATGSLAATSQVKSLPSAEDHVSTSEQEDEQSGGEKPDFRSPIRQLVKGQTIEDDYAGMD